MSRPRVVVSHSEIPKEAIDLLKQRCDVTICPELPYPDRKALLKVVKGIDALFYFSKNIKLDKEILDEAGPNLKVIGTMSAGYDHIDVHEIKSRGIKLGSTPKVLDAAVADMGMALALAVGRRLPEGHSKIVNNQWKSGIFRPQWMLGQDFQNATVGIIGLGGIGQAIAHRVKGFDISRLVYCGHNPKQEASELNAEFVSFDELLRLSDFIFIACPLTKETANLINEDAFSKMKSNAILVNVSRGAIVDQDALIEALKTHKIWGAGLDVTTPEPLPFDHPLVSINNCVVAPHFGTATLKTRTDMALLTVQNIFAGLDGKPLPFPV